ncbi:MAG: DNA polymerase/3'-5' exonuclease PolX [Candidatus Omnitrophota bacterium]|nr:DNA polymerase/3'-5' exonuclease PolX [Candidatus Omnitrophota bacterium]
MNDKKSEIAGILNQIADLLEIKEENPFRIRAYRRAAQSVERLSQNLEKLAGQDRLTEIPGVGHDLSLKIKEFLSTGKVKFHQELIKKSPQGFLELMTVSSIGPKTAKLLSEKLNIKSINQLEKYARFHKITGLPGLKEKSEDNILKGIEFLKRTRTRTPLGIACYITEEIIGQLEELPQVTRISPAGSLRRMRETVGDIDILVAAKSHQQVMDTFVNLPLAKEVLAHGPTKSSIRAKEGIQVDLRVVAPGSFGAALAYFTGSKEHNIKLRRLALKKGLKINEYGVFDVKTKKKIAGKEEFEIYKTLGLAFIPPEIREDQEEIERGLKKRIPKLLERSDIKGDLHIHSNYSDGANTIKEIAQVSQRMGYEYIAICDHSKSLAVAGGVPVKKLLKKIEEIKKLNKKLRKIRVLAGAEVNILPDGSLDYEDSLLKQLDFVVAAVHTGFKQNKEALTDRIVRAMENKYVHLIAHPTGRLIGVRDPYGIDLEKIFKAAKETNTALEINAFPARLDLNDRNCFQAKEKGVNLIITTDAHTIGQLNNMFFGVSVARRGWLKKKDILNTLPVRQFLEKITKR